jgi:DNA repair photolyase
MSTKYKKIACKRILSKFGVLGTRFWTTYSFDPYENCEFNCVYCNKCATGYSDSPSQSIPVNVKLNAPNVLAGELDQLRRKGVLRMGIWSDPYQPAEGKYRITKQMLEIMREHEFPFAIGTKSDLILRDLDLISEASRKFHCVVALSFSTLDERLGKLLEPNAPSPKRRLEVVRRLSEAGITTGIWLAPIFPYWTDSEEKIGRTIKAAVDNGANFVLGAVYDNRNPIKFTKFLEEQFIQLTPKYKRLYARDRPCHYPIDEFYLHNLARKFISQCQKKGVKKFLPHFSTRKQAWLFYVRNFSKFEGSPFVGFTQLLNYLSPSQEILQTIRIRLGNQDISKAFLKIFGYFPH